MPFRTTASWQRRRPTACGCWMWGATSRSGPRPCCARYGRCSSRGARVWQAHGGRSTDLRRYEGELWFRAQLGLQTLEHRQKHCPALRGPCSGFTEPEVEQHKP